RTERIVYALEVLADRRNGRRAVVFVGFGFDDIGVAQSVNDGRRADLFIRRARGAGLAALPLHLAALVEIILDPGAGGEIRDEVELQPETVEFLLAALVENQFLQRDIVAEISHDVVKARAQKAAFVLRIVRIVASALANVEGIREDIAETREGGLVGRAPAL